VLQTGGITVIEINRPDRTRRRGRGKSDATDAESAARSVLAGDARSIPKAHNGLAEGLRTLSLVRRSAVKAETQTINQNTGIACQRATSNPRCGLQGRCGKVRGGMCSIVSGQHLSVTGQSANSSTLVGKAVDGPE